MVVVIVAAPVRGSWHACVVPSPAISTIGSFDDPTADEVDRVLSCDEALEAVGALLQGRGVRVHLPDGDDAFGLMVAVAGYGTESRFSFWRCYPKFVFDWARRTRVEDEHEHASYLLWLTAQDLRRHARSTAHDLLAELPDDEGRIGAIEAVNRHWARWWDALVTEGHTSESAAMLLELTVPTGDLRLLLRDAAGRPAATAAPPTTLPSVSACA